MLKVVGPPSLGAMEMVVSMRVVCLGGTTGSPVSLVAPGSVVTLVGIGEKPGSPVGGGGPQVGSVGPAAQLDSSVEAGGGTTRVGSVGPLTQVGTSVGMGG